MIDLIEFKQRCNNGKCLRQTIKSKQCLKESKQESCYEKYKSKLKSWNDKKYEKDYEWEALKNELKLRDFGCLAEQILTKEELKIAQSHEGYWLNKFVDGAHILSRVEAPNHILNYNNVILLGRYFHKMLDDHCDLVTGEQKDFNCKKYWITRIMQARGYWKADYTYDDFRKDLLGY